jgi:hypothetical protein
VSPEDPGVHPFLFDDSRGGVPIADFGFRIADCGRRVREEDGRIADWKKRGIGDCWKRVWSFGLGRVLPIDRGQGVALGVAKSREETEAGDYCGEPCCSGLEGRRNPHPVVGARAVMTESSAQQAQATWLAAQRAGGPAGKLP